jgi:hypothetical protein
MKKTFLVIPIFLILIAGSYFAFRHLPLSITRRSDIKLGEQIIKNIEGYQKQNGLPNNDDWETLRTLGFKDKGDFLQPEYRKLNENEFELVYVENFDGPYLMWNSLERKWKKGFLRFDKQKT